jgi:hypothetical protein
MTGSSTRETVLHPADTLLKAGGEYENNDMQANGWAM